MGLKRDEFERMTIGELNCRYKGFIRENERRLHEVRLLMWAAIQPHSKRKLRPKDIMQLPGDKAQFQAVDVETYKALIDGKTNT